ncbi:hypothetical protein J3R30DRAFT_3480382 [Lentinula aciculospora]|uniref:Uncharacterized protein n=1 Tax=Lentinula aciculospora TaxID=153920 RepID=A0A9W9DMT9_9AGAR|nr:hypothetical protein J3R30DRAFT_3480382 [Lentinula aciculospora]
MSVRTVQTSFTSNSASTAAMSTMIATSHVLSAVDLNAVYPPGLESYRAEKGPASRGRSYSGSPARNLYSNPVVGDSRNFNRPGNNKRYPQGMRLPSSSYHQVQNQTRRAGYSNSPAKSMKQANSSTGTPFYQRTSRFDPFGDTKEITLSLSPTITSSTRSSNASEPLYTHYYYYDASTNRPTLAYADDKTTANAANLTASTNLLLDTLLNGRRSPSPPQPTIATPAPAAVQTSTTVDSPSQPRSRSSSPPHSPRPRAVAISLPSSTITPSPLSSQSIMSVSPPPPPPAPIKVSKAQRDAIARIVANILLNRADGVSRRGRRCNGSGYVKSSLSRVVFVE